MLTSIMGWVALGLIVGFLINVIIFRKGEDRQMDVLLGVCGAVLGGLLYKIFSTALIPPAAAFSMRNILPAVIGTVATLIIWHMIKGSLSRA